MIFSKQLYSKALLLMAKSNTAHFPFALFYKWNINNKELILNSVMFGWSTKTVKTPGRFGEKHGFFM